MRIFNPTTTVVAVAGVVVAGVVTVVAKTRILVWYHNNHAISIL